MRFPEHSALLALGGSVWRVQFCAAHRPLMVRRAVRPRQTKGGGQRRPHGGDLDALDLDMELEWSAARGTPPAGLAHVILRATDLMTHHHWPPRVGDAY